MKKDIEIIAGVFSSVIAGIITEFINKGCITEQYIVTKTTTGFSINTICEYNFWKTIISLFGVFLLVWFAVYLLLCLLIPIVNRIIKVITTPKKKRMTNKEIVEEYFSIKNEFILLEKDIKGRCPIDNSLKLLHFTELCRIINNLYKTLSQISPENSSTIFRIPTSVANIDKYITRYDCLTLLDEIEKTLTVFVCDENNFKEDFKQISEKINRLKSSI